MQLSQPRFSAPASKSRVVSSFSPHPLAFSSSRSRGVRRVRSARPEPFKYVHFPPPAELGFEVSVGTDETSVTLSTKRPIKGVILDVDGEQDAQWSDQAIDLVPDDPQTVVVQGLGGRTVRARFLGDGSA